MGNLGTVTIKVKSGVEYEFSLYSVNQSFNAVGAVYAMLEFQLKQGSPWYLTIESPFRSLLLQPPEGGVVQEAG